MTTIVDLMYDDIIFELSRHLGWDHTYKLVQNLIKNSNVLWDKLLRLNLYFIPNNFPNIYDLIKSSTYQPDLERLGYELQATINVRIDLYLKDKHFRTLEDKQFSKNEYMENIALNQTVIWGLPELTRLLINTYTYRNFEIEDAMETAAMYSQRVDHYLWKHLPKDIQQKYPRIFDHIEVIKVLYSRDSNPKMLEQPLLSAINSANINAFNYIRMKISPGYDYNKALHHVAESGTYIEMLNFIIENQEIDASSIFG